MIAAAIDEKTENRKKIVLLFSVFSLFILFLKNTPLLSALTLGGLKTALRVLPSIFPSLVLSGIVLRAGAVEYFSAHCGRLFARFFRLPRVSFAVFLLGLFCGFPIGAKLSAELYEKGLLSRRDAERTAAFTNFCSPPFLIGAVGQGIFSAPAVGWQFFVLQTASALLFAFVTRPRTEDLLTGENSSLPSRSTSPSVFALLSSSIGEAAPQALRLAGFILFFSILSGVIISPFADFFALHPALKCLTLGFFEISSGVSALADLPTAERYSAALAVICFSGVSVLMQASSFLAEKSLSPKQLVFAHISTAVFFFFALKILQLIIS